MFLLAFIHYGRALLQPILLFHIISLLSLMNQAPGFTLVSLPFDVFFFF